MTRGRLLAFMQRTPRWRVLRRAAHDTLSPRAVALHAPLQTSEARRLVHSLLTHPHLPVSAHSQRFSTSTAIQLLYGLAPLRMGGADPARRLGEVAGELFGSVKPGRSVVDLLPVLRGVVARSAFLRRKADVWYEQVPDLYTKFYWSASADSTQPCISVQLREGKYKDISEVDAAWLVGVLLLASQDTTRVALQYFFLAIVLHPQYAAQAQEQLDTVVGSRPPTFDDLPRLPWIEAILKEVLRWRSPTPLGKVASAGRKWGQADVTSGAGLAHAASEDICYGEYVIPKGTMIFANLWGMSHDPDLYPNPEQFDPSRFLLPSGELRPAPPDTHEDYLTFGHGRRACPGKDLVLRELWIAFAYVLWAFELKKALDDAGKEITPDPDAFVDVGAVVCPAEMGVRAVPRFANLEDLLEKARSEMK
ncbi:cytochrome P450 [Calocera cornea HHB12733]|uniref:Cytochrome P450 n=1 Tax=Calocera cornea HHB12733 TaxID=1353952 RepID=A0A165FF77_9BASI|nr:cytochrome P450 [Calocera cornea HHB12733]